MTVASANAISCTLRLGTSQTLSTGELSNVYYDYNDGRLVKITRKQSGSTSDDEITEYAYTKRGDIDRQWGSGSFPINYDYDSYGRLEEQRQYRDGSNATGTNIAYYSKVKWVRQANTGLVTSKRHYDGGTYDDTSLQYNDLGAMSKRTWDRGVYTDFVYSIGSNTKTGELLEEDHSDSTPDVTYTYDRMGRLYTVDDVTGLRTFHYTKQSNMALNYEDLPNGFFGSSNINYYYESAGTGKIEGRYYTEILNGAPPLKRLPAGWMW